MTSAPAMDRRDVLKLGGAAALALLAPDAVAAAVRASSLASTIVVADPRYRESLIFAGSLERHGAKVLTLASDRAASWFGAIAPQLPRGLHRLTGLTLESDLFILERLAGYRAHISEMDLVAAQFDFNDHAAMRVYDRLKDALDPGGVLSPGKQGIWPKALRRAKNEGGGTP